MHAYAVLSTHFHLLVRSTDGSLAVAMQRIQNSYVRWFNRRRKRDGPLFRGRYLSKRVETEAYWDAVVAYIDRNPEEAGMTKAASHYPGCSAYHFARHTGPPWHSRQVIEEAVCLGTRTTIYEPSAYADVFSTSTDIESRSLERELRFRRKDGDREELAAYTPEHIRDWMQRKARLADGSTPGLTAMTRIDLRKAIEECRAKDPGWSPESRKRVQLGWDVLEVGLLRMACGLQHSEIRHLLAHDSPKSVESTLRIHNRLSETDPTYGRHAAAVLQAAKKLGSAPG